MPIVSLQFSSTIPRNARGLDLHSYLCQRFTYHSAQEWQNFLQLGQVKLNGKLGHGLEMLMGDENLRYFIPEYDEPEIPVSWELIVETDDYILVGKSAGSPIARTGRIVYNTLTNLIRRHFGSEEISPLHRLDRETSGLILFGKTKDVCRVPNGLAPAVLGRKCYLAVVHGELLHPVSCIAAIKESKVAPIPARMVVDPLGKISLSSFWPLAQRNELTLVLCEIYSGRKHQIRAHLEHLGYPIYGDKIYGSDGWAYVKMASQGLDSQDLLQLGSDNHLLHAWMGQFDLDGKGFCWYESRHWSPEFLDLLEEWPGIWQHLQRVKTRLETNQCPL